MIEKEKMIKRIQKLLTLSRDKGATEAEAKNAAGQARKLMNKYDLSLSEVDIKKSEIGEAAINTGTVRPKFWMKTLGVAVANAFDCRIFGRGYAHIVFLGTKVDVEVASYVYEYLFFTMSALIERRRLWFLRERKKVKEHFVLYSEAPVHLDPRSYLKGYAFGLVIAVDDTLSKQKAERERAFEKREEEAPPSTGTGKDLIVLKMALVDRVYDKLMKGTKKRSSYRPKMSEAAFNDGKRDGKNIKINPALKDTAKDGGISHLP